MKEKTDREQFDDRLQKAFGSDWLSLPEKRKESALDRLLEIEAGPELKNEFDLKQMLDVLQHKTLSIGTILIGAILAIFGGLTVNIIHDYFKEYGLVYFILAPAGFLLLLFILDRELDRHITETHKKKNTLKFLFKLTESEGVE